MLVNRRHSSGSSFAGGLTSRASTSVIDTVSGSVLANPWRGRLTVTGPARSATVAIRPRSPTRRGATLTGICLSSGQAAALANNDASSTSGPVLRRTNDEVDPRGATGEAAVNVALAVADDHHHRRRIRQHFSGSLDPSQPANALLVLNGTLAAWRRLDLAVTGLDVRVEKTENSLRLAVDGDQGVDEKAGRSPIAGGSKPAAIDRAAGEIDLGGVLRDDN